MCHIDSWGHTHTEYRVSPRVCPRLQEEAQTRALCCAFLKLFALYREEVTCAVQPSRSLRGDRTILHPTLWGHRVGGGDSYYWEQMAETTSS